MYKTAILTDIGRRISMEDAHALVENFDSEGAVFGGVFDGHGGDFAAKHAAERIPVEFGRLLCVLQNPADAFTLAYEKVDSELAGQDMGTTAATFYLRGKSLTAANAGDARILVIGKTSVRQLTVDHRVSDPEERARIISHGGQIERDKAVRVGNVCLMPTRALGDADFRSAGVIPTPFVKEDAIGADDLWLLAACDGVFDVMTNEEVAELLRRFDDPQKAAEALKHEVLASRNGRDNLTIMLLRLE